ncbi:unnamed protein product [Eruca vesicaria subsp. sativa]|uniref:Uncharacterized protein n=1 Tax=Eruca vesicaria subsp. sativa TaxID=29727 RepID=A0ABC8M872_ERUVS|nr:unnamed protein product [Eruca vesicaria subsp. sativa]
MVFDAIMAGLGLASPPIMALLYILDDEVVKVSSHARAIRDVEDEELHGFFHEMSAWQNWYHLSPSCVLYLVYRALADIFLRGTDLFSDSRGKLALTGILPPFVPFAQACAATITAALTGSLYYIAASPKRSSPLLEGLLGLFLGFEWIQVPLLLFLTHFYDLLSNKSLKANSITLQKNNLLAPIITHGIYSAVALGNGSFTITSNDCD